MGFLDFLFGKKKNNSDSKVSKPKQALKTTKKKTPSKVKIDSSNLKEVEGKL